MMKEQINPLLAIMSPRDIPFIKRKYDQIDYVDKLWVKYYNEPDALKEITKYFNEHKEYTHLIINSDDSAPDYEHIAMLIADIEKYGFEAICGTIGFDGFADDDRLSVTIDPVLTNYEGKTQLEHEDYHRLPSRFLNLKGIIKIWYNGLNILTISRRIFEKIGLHCMWDGLFMSDTRFSWDAAQNNIPVYCDLRIFYWHYRHELPRKDPEWKVIPEYSKQVLRFEKSTKEIPVCEPAPFYETIPQEYLNLNEMTHNPRFNRRLKLCLVTEFNQEVYFQWHTALNEFRKTHPWCNVSGVIANPQMIEMNRSNIAYWEAIKEADAVFVYVPYRVHRWIDDKIFDWYSFLPRFVRSLMRPDAKMIVQYDDDLMWTFEWERHSFNLGWEKDQKYIEYLKKKLDNLNEFFSFMNDADAYFTVVENVPWKRYTTKPVYIMPLPQLSRYNISQDYYNSTKNLNFSFIKKNNMLVTLKHSFRLSSVDSTLNLSKMLNLPITLFTSRQFSNSQENKTILNSLPVESKILDHLPKEKYMEELSHTKIAIDDNFGYDGWSRFAMECGIAGVPCIGSTLAVKEFFPDLYTKPQDLEVQKKLVQKLLDDRDFYIRMVLRGRKRIIYKLSDENLCMKLCEIFIFDLKCKTTEFNFTNSEEEKEIRRHELINILRIYLRKGQTIPKCPSEGCETFDGALNISLNRAKWLNLYERYKDIIDNDNDYKACKAKASRTLYSVTFK